MSKEKNEISSINDTKGNKLLNSAKETTNKKFELFNVVSETGDSISAVSFEELAGIKEGNVYISIDRYPEIKEFIEKRDKRVGSSLSNKHDN